MRSRAMLTVAAIAAAGGGPATAGSAAAMTAPLTTAAPATAPKATPAPGILAVENGFRLGDGWCVAPLRWSGPLIADPFPTTSDACVPVRAGDGIHVLSNLCIAPISTDDPPGSPAAPSTLCRYGSVPAPGFEVLRNVSVAGVQATF